MNLNFKKILRYALLILLIPFLFFIIYFFIGKPKEVERIDWGINFSQKQAEKMGLDWKKTYLSLLNDLGVKNIKIASYWDLLEPEEGEYYFNDLDWQIREAEKRQIRILLVIGMKTPRWPECHIPKWAEELNKDEQQNRVLKLVEKIVSRYQDKDSVWAWQVENEPFFFFGECPWADKGFLKKEIDLVKSLDSKKRFVIISDSGEWSFWIKAAKFGDVVGTTVYRRAWFPTWGIYFRYIFPPIFYWRRAQIIKKFFGKEVICVELQAEPWGPTLLYNLPLAEQEKTMNLEQFKEDIEFAKKTGLKKFYLWGAEWWFWLKEKEGKPEIWEAAESLFKTGKL